jgi:membrane protein DedA with SNARE-associated domain
MDMTKFIIYTFLGSFPWCLMLAWVGVKVGENLEVLKPYFHRFDAVIGLVLLAGIVFWVWRHLRQNHEVAEADSADADDNQAAQ